GRHGFRSTATNSTRQGTSEEELQCHLHVERLARTDAGRTARIFDGVSYPTQSAADAAARLREVHAVEDVEHLDPQLSAHRLPDRDVFEENCEIRPRQLLVLRVAWSEL